MRVTTFATSRVGVIVRSAVADAASLCVLGGTGVNVVIGVDVGVAIAAGGNVIVPVGFSVLVSVGVKIEPNNLSVLQDVTMKLVATIRVDNIINWRIPQSPYYPTKTYISFVQSA
ncbi:MAG: hypothetical protein A2136_09825 [Chloroflexi bacterium RBG_16_54_11]|nr:MAG: hypothetical protein A2136_09825 [Chloroflexi bacterium RBG_16_54_11]